jgi:hypothetical protein
MRTEQSIGTPTGMTPPSPFRGTSESECSAQVLAAGRTEYGERVTAVIDPVKVAEVVESFRAKGSKWAGSGRPRIAPPKAPVVAHAGGFVIQLGMPRSTRTM